MNYDPDRSRPLPKLRPRAADSHKGDYGRALLIGGSRGMSGAICLAGMATLRSGAGLVKLAVADCCLDSVAACEPSYMTAPLPSDEQGRIAGSARTALEELAQQATALACGPGLGRSPQLDELVAWLYTKLPQPLVVDADGLNALAGQQNVLRNPGGPRVLTPHPGEFRRLMNTPQRLEAEQAFEEAIKLADRCGIVVVLKGHRTLITDGREWAINQTGNPGMATGGSGDVLTGVITGLLCQGLSPIDAAQLGAHVHGSAGDLAAEYLGEVSIIASDLIGYLSTAFVEVC